MPVVQCNVSSVPDDALMMIMDELHEPTAQRVSADDQTNVGNIPLTAELARYKELVGMYETRAKFENRLTQFWFR